jgi:integrase
MEPSGLSLRAYFDQVYSPTFLIECSPRTIDEHHATLNHWERIVGQPSLAAITAAMLGQFLAGLRGPRPKRSGGLRQIPLPGFEAETTEADRGLSPATVNKHRRQLLALLYKAGPAGPRNRDALGILVSVPWVRAMKQQRRLPRGVDDAVLEALYRGAEAAFHPRLPDIPAADWWRGLIVGAVTLGFRRNALMALRWDWIDWGSSTIFLPASADKMGSDRQKPLVPLLLRHLTKIRHGDPRIFPWPGGWPHGETTFYRQWHDIQRSGGIPLVQRIKLHDLKRACGTRLASSGASPWVIQQMLDHGSLTTSRSYINATDAMREAVQKMPLPACFFEEDE